MAKKQNFNYRRIFFGCVLLFIFMGNYSQAQYVKGYNVPDTIFLEKHSPHKATFYSALVPGLGQIYNKKYWKLPIIYGGTAILTYYLGYNSYVYEKYTDIYNIKVKISAGDSTLTDPFPGYSTETFEKRRDSWRKYRDMTIIGLGILYVAQIIDANVDAHLFDYDISEDLSFRVEPTIQVDPKSVVYAKKKNTSVGLRCTIRF